MSTGRDTFYPSAFDELWEHYPNRPNNPKMLAFKAYRQRLLQGTTAVELIQAVKEYAFQMQKAGKVGTEFVMQARTFLGPNERWREFVPKPEKPKPVITIKHCPDPEARIDGRPFIKEILSKLAAAKGA